MKNKSRQKMKNEKENKKKQSPLSMILTGILISQKSF